MRIKLRCAAIIVRGAEVLLVRSLKSPEELWIPPGGKFEEEDFSVFECAKREAYEESGVAVSINKLIGMNEIFDEEKKIFTIELFFLSEPFEGVTKNGYVFEKNNSEKRSPKWFTAKELKMVKFSPEDLILSGLDEI